MASHLAPRHCPLRGRLLACGRNRSFRVNKAQTQMRLLPPGRAGGTGCRVMADRACLWGSWGSGTEEGQGVPRSSHLGTSL